MLGRPSKSRGILQAGADSNALPEVDLEHALKQLDDHLQRVEQDLCLTMASISVAKSANTEVSIQYLDTYVDPRS